MQNLSREKLVSSESIIMNSILITGYNFLYYPIYRTFIIHKKITLSDNFLNDMSSKNNIKILKKQTGGLYRGFLHYNISRIFPTIIFTEFYKPENKETTRNDLISTIGIGMIPSILCYPFYVNSHLLSLNLPAAISLKNPFNVFKIISKKDFYRGFSIHVYNSFLFFIPFLNYLSYSTESYRLAYILGPHYGKKFTRYKEAKNYLIINDLIHYGKNIYNLPIHIYNSIWFLMPFLLFLNK